MDNVNTSTSNSPPNLKSAIRGIRSAMPEAPPTLSMVMMHPKTLRWIKANLGGAPLTGLNIKTVQYAPRWFKKWQFPTERYWQYEASDEGWCRYFDVGHEVDDTDRPWIAVIR